MSRIPFVQLNDGNRMPAIGLGTCAVSFFLFGIILNEMPKVFLML